MRYISLLPPLKLCLTTLASLTASLVRSLKYSLLQPVQKPKTIFYGVSIAKNYLQLIKCFWIHAGLCFLRVFHDYRIKERVLVGGGTYS
jgi:hypothetical protein